ncbi:hypothetical protein KIPB_012189, partial [Kipferlia bialata]|eukprot:g12189.t1
MELLRFGDLRVDGRRPDQLRRISIDIDVVPNSDGSVLFRQGNTFVLASVCGPNEPTGSSGLGASEGRSGRMGVSVSVVAPSSGTVDGRQGHT